MCTANYSLVELERITCGREFIFEIVKELKKKQLKKTKNMSKERAWALGCGNTLLLLTKLAPY